METNLKTLLAEKGMRLSDLARALGIDKSLATRWAQRRVPAERAVDVMKVTGIPKERIRPDIFGAVSEAAE